MSDLVKHNPVQKLQENNGDLSTFTAIDRKVLYVEMCRAHGFDTLSFPFDYIKTKGGGLKLYVNSVGASLMREKFQVSLQLKSREFVEGMWVVTVIAIRGNRTEEAIGAVAPDNYMSKADALKKAETQAKRRATLSICGWGWDEDPGTVMKAETYDPPQNILPTSKQPDVWRSWRCEQDAINWALNELPELSEEEIEAEFYALPEGKKAVVWVHKVNQLKIRDF